VIRITDLFKKLSLHAKLILIGLVPTIFFLYVSFQYYSSEKQKLSLLHEDIKIINRAEAINKLIDELVMERRYAFDFALKKIMHRELTDQWRHTDAAINNLVKIDSGLNGFQKYTMLEGLANIRKANDAQKLLPDAAMGYYSTAIFRMSTLNVAPQFILADAKQINQNLHGQKLLSEMYIMMGAMRSNILNVLETRKNGLGTLYGLIGVYQIYNTYEMEFLARSSPQSVKLYQQVKQHSALKPVTAYLDNTFKKMQFDSTTYTADQWHDLSKIATDELRDLQLKIWRDVNAELSNIKAGEQAKTEQLLVLLIIALALITATVSYTIREIRIRLTELTTAAEKIAVGDTVFHPDIYSNDIIGRLAASVAKIDENNKVLAGAANAIGGGNFDVPVNPRGANDLLGNALLRMKDDLQRFTTENLANAVELERLLDMVKQSESHFRQIADQTPLMIWQVDNKADSIYVNRQWLDFTGLSFEESMGRDWMVVIHPDDMKERAFTKAFADRVPYRSKSRFRNAQGEYRWMYIQGNPIFNNGIFEGFIGSLTDITDQIHAEDAILELMYKKDEFLSIASHELRTPLTSIKAYAQLLAKTANPDEKSFPFINKTLIHVARLEKLINDLLDVSRINSGKMDYDLEVFQFEDLLKNSVEAFRDVTPRHKVILSNMAQGFVMADRQRIEQVFNNLLNNAAKYSPDADTIEVNAITENGYVIVSVHDHGVGIAKQDWGLLFERFYRSEKTYNKFQGLGLGLFISSEIVKRHHGEIWVDSEPGNGSTFYFKLPLYQQTQEQENSGMKQAAGG